MKSYLILAQSPQAAKGLETAVKYFRNPGEGSSVETVWKQPIGAPDGIEPYESLVKLIDRLIRTDLGAIGGTLVVALVDEIRPLQLDVTAGGWDSTMAMLILGFPEIRWVFGNCSGVDANTKVAPAGGSSSRLDWGAIIADHSLGSLVDPAPREPLFDPTGLRNWVRAVSNAGLRRSGDDLVLPTRELTAAAIDEESLYAYLHAHTAYRFGCRTDVITRWALMKRRFGGAGPHGYWLLLEDMSLNFVDKPASLHLLHLEAREGPNGVRTGREHHCPQLRSEDPEAEHSEHRLLITAGQSQDAGAALDTNRAYLNRKSDATGRGTVIPKPAGGMFDLWKEAGLSKRWSCTCLKGNVDRFVWPPAGTQRSSDHLGGHGAPGKLILIAETLIDRARRLLNDPDEAGHSVQGAVLATDAMEMIGNRTPTSALEALTLKHQFELLTECQFAGVRYHLEIQSRIEEIAFEADAIARWFGPRPAQKSASFNGQMKLIARLIDILRCHGQYDEEQVCMNRVRYLHHKLWMHSPYRAAAFGDASANWVIPWRVLLSPLLSYLRLLLRSFSMFLVVLFAWILGLTLLFQSSNGVDHSFVGGLTDAISAFFSQGSPFQGVTSATTKSEEPHLWWRVSVACIAIVAGTLHLGVFISHLYAMASRKG